MKVCFICVTYNSYHHLMTFVRSIDASISHLSDIDLKFIVVDNSTATVNYDIINMINEIMPDFKYIKSDNIGYFPAAALALDVIYNEISSYDYVAVSNVDLEVSYDFFSNLIGLNIGNNVGVIAPSIISKKRRADLNPKIILRPSLKKLKRNLMIFKFAYLFWIYVKLSNLKFRFLKTTISLADNIYAPHGSFMLFTRNYFITGGNLNYPCFLFGEEIYVGEECLKRNLYVRYIPNLIVNDTDHGSTSLLNIGFISDEATKSMQYIINTYFRN